MLNAFLLSYVMISILNIMIVAVTYKQISNIKLNWLLIEDEDVWLDN